MVDKIPPLTNIPLRKIKISTQSTISNITSEKNIEEKLIRLIIFYIIGIKQILQQKEKEKNKRYRNLDNKRKQITHNLYNV